MNKKQISRNKYTIWKRFKNNRLLKYGVISGAVIIIIVAFAAISSQNGLSADKGHFHTDAEGKSYYHSEAEITRDTDLTIVQSEVSSNARYYPYEINNVDMEVLAVKLDDGTVKAALNTCLSCYNTGRGYFEQKGNQLICQNCGNSFELKNVGLEKGECYPLPIPSSEITVDGDNLVISKTFLDSQQKMFSNWR